MLAARKYSQKKTPAPTKQLAPDHEPDLKYNDVWQSLALHAAHVQTKLAVGQPDDPYEHEADRIADQVMRMPTPDSSRSQLSFSSVPPVEVQRACDHCEEEEERLQRKAEPGAADQAPAAFAPQIVLDTLSSPGESLDPETRDFMEARFEEDFSHVRVHTDARAHESARAINALAYTRGSDIVFGARYQSRDVEGRTLLAHELVHSLQQSPQSHPQATPPGLSATARGSGESTIGIPSQNTGPQLQRALDPANEAAWSWFGPDYRRRDWRREYTETLSAAAGAAQQLTTDLSGDRGPALTIGPEHDAWQDRFAEQVETLVRLNALGLMAAHRAFIQGRRDELVHPEPGTAAGPGAAGQLRDAARLLGKLTSTKEYLENSRSAIQLVGTESRTAICLWMNSCVDAWLGTMLNNIRRYQPPAIRAFWNERVRMLLEGRVPEGLLRAFFSVTAGHLADFRARQLSGVNFSINEVYNHFPLFKTLSAQSVRENSDYAADDALMRAAAQAYVELLNDVDQAIVQIGSGDIHPFNLPVPVRETRESLPSALRPEIDAVFGSHRTDEFWRTMTLTFAQVIAVFIPVIGPVLAFTIGAGMAASDIESLLDRIELAEASTSPEGDILGATAPSPLEYLMSALQVVLTAVDLGMVLSELRAVRAPGEEAVALTHAEGEGSATRAHDRPPEPAARGEQPTTEHGTQSSGRDAPVSADEGADVSGAATPQPPSGSQPLEVLPGERPSWRRPEPRGNLRGIAGGRAPVEPPPRAPSSSAQPVPVEIEQVQAIGQRVAVGAEPRGPVASGSRRSTPRQPAEPASPAGGTRTTGTATPSERPGAGRTAGRTVAPSALRIRMDAYVERLLERFPRLRQARLRAEPRRVGAGMFEERAWTGGDRFSFEGRLRDGRRVQLDDISPGGVVTETKTRNVGDDGLIVEQRDPVALRDREDQMFRQSQFISENGLPHGVWMTDNDAMFGILVEIRARYGIHNLDILPIE
jgi:Domain of unknown function (DUF4157)